MLKKSHLMSFEGVRIEFVADGYPACKLLLGNGLEAIRRGVGRRGEVFLEYNQGRAGDPTRPRDAEMSKSRGRAESSLTKKMDGGEGVLLGCCCKVLKTGEK